MVARVRSSSTAALGVGVLYSFAALGVVQKYAGTAAALVVLALSPVVGAAVASLVSFGRRLTPRQAELMAVAVLAIALVALVVVYPQANTHAVGTGSDRDDAATIGARGFLHLRNPYGSFTYLHDPISQLPVLLVFAMPFVGLFGSSAYELVVFLPLLYLLWRWLAGDARVALAGLVITLASPALLRDYLTGGDLTANFVLVGAAVFALWRYPSSLLAAVALGVALATRANFAIIVVPLAVAAWRRCGVTVAVRATVVVLAVLAVITIPVALSAGGRTALRMNDKLSEVPGGAPLVLSLAVVIAFVLAASTSRWTAKALLTQVAGVQAFFLVAVILTDSARAGRPDFFWLISGYGVPAFLFGTAALMAGNTQITALHSSA